MLLHAIIWLDILLGQITAAAFTVALVRNSSIITAKADISVMLQVRGVPSRRLRLLDK